MALIGREPPADISYTTGSFTLRQAWVGPLGTGLEPPRDQLGPLAVISVGTAALATVIGLVALLPGPVSIPLGILLGFLASTLCRVVVLSETHAICRARVTAIVVVPLPVCLGLVGASSCPGQPDSWPTRFSEPVALGC